MAPLDDLSGDRVLAEFEAMIRGTGGLDSVRQTQDEFRGLVPERRAVNWVNALAALAREIEERQGPRRAEILLRTVGTRMSHELLTPLPTVRDEFEPAINRALSILDWGWVAVLDRQDTIVFEHRTPWPFEKRLDHLPFVLEGFYTDTLHRLAGNDAMQVRLTGNRGAALVFKWVPADVQSRAASTPGSSIIVPAGQTKERKTDIFPTISGEDASLMAELKDVALDEFDVEDEPSADRRLPPLSDRANAPLHPRDPAAPVTARRMRVGSGTGSARALLVAAAIFVVLFGFGVMSSGDMISSVTQRLAQMTGSGADQSSTASEVENRALAGDVDAEIRLGLQLVNGTGTAKPNYADAARWFQAAAKTGSHEAQYDLGVMTAGGLGVKRDPVEAAILFMNAAAGGFAAAEYRIGAAYQNGTGVPRSTTFAAMWYERAARHGVRQAQVALAGLYATGDGVAADPVVAFAWYRLAEEEGDRVATAKRVDLYRHMSTAQREAALNQAKVLISDVSGSALSPAPAHPTVDRLIAQIS